MYSDLLDFIDKFELSQDFSEDSSLYRIHAARVKETGATCLLLYLDGSKPAGRVLPSAISHLPRFDFDSNKPYENRGAGGDAATKPDIKRSQRPVAALLGGFGKKA